MFKLIKWAFLSAVALVLLGFLFFGPRFFSYAGSSLRLIKGTVRQAVPMEFELRRARDLLEDLTPEIQAQIVAVAKEEVAVEELEKEIVRRRARTDGARASLAQLRDDLQESSLETSPVSYGNRVNELSRRFTGLTLAEKLLKGHEKVLAARKQSLAASVRTLREAQVRKIELEAAIEQLANQLRLMKYQKEAPLVTVDRSKLVEAEELVAELRKRCAVAERVLSCQTQIAPLAAPEVTENELLTQVDAYLGQ